MGFFRDKTRKDWIYKFEYRGRSHGGRGFKTKAAAVAARELHRARLRVEKSLMPLASTPIDMDFLSASNLYLDQGQRQFVEKTFKYKEYVIKQFLAHCGNMPCSEIAPHHITKYLLTRKSDNNYNTHRKDLSAVFSYIKNVLGCIDINPVAKAPRLSYSPKRKHIPTYSDIKKVFGIAKPVDKAFLWVILLTGARVDEIQRLAWADVDFQNATITRYTKKRRDHSYAPITTKMNRELFAVLIWMSDRVRRRADTDLVFPNPQNGRKYKQRFKLIRALCRRAGLKKAFTYHGIRHFVASFLAGKKGITKKSIGEMLGHMNLSTTELYLHSLSDGAAVASDALEGEFDFGVGLGVGFEPKRPLLPTPDGNNNDENP